MSERRRIDDRLRLGKLLSVAKRAAYTVRALPGPHRVRAGCTGGVERIYLDHAASAPLSMFAMQRMREALERFGNPSSQHEEGRAAREVVDRCRAALLDAVNATVEGGKYEFSDVIFTSGGTEAANLALVGTALASDDSVRRRIVISAAEHACTFGAVSLLERLGFLVEVGPVDRFGRLLPVASSDDLFAVAAMRANNELGTLQDGSAVPEGALHLMDGVQAFGKTPVGRMPSCLWVSAHKIRGPKGIGALLLAPGVKVAPLISGGEQERERRGGTENLIGLAGFLGALEDLPASSASLAARDQFWDRLASGGGLPTVPDRSLVQATHAHFRFPGLDAETLLLRLDREGVAASAGAACSSGSVEPSRVMLACGYSEQEAKEGVRFSFGQETTVEQAERAAEIVIGVVADVRRRRGL